MPLNKCYYHSILVILGGWETAKIKVFFKIMLLTAINMSTLNEKVKSVYIRTFIPLPKGRLFLD